MELINTSFIENKKSKFYGYLYNINNQDEVKTITSNLKSQYKNIRHMPYAYRINNTASKTNDKEPGNIGLAFLNILGLNNLNSHLLIVIRIYGGVKLGASNLARTYYNTANLCIKK